MVVSYPQLKMVAVESHIVLILLFVDGGFILIVTEIIPTDSSVS